MGRHRYSDLSAPSHHGKMVPRGNFVRSESPSRRKRSNDGCARIPIGYLARRYVGLCVGVADTQQDDPRPFVAGRVKSSSAAAAHGRIPSCRHGVFAGRDRKVEMR